MLQSTMCCKLSATQGPGGRGPRASPEPCSPLTRSHTPHPRLLFLIHFFLLSSRFRTSHPLIHLVALQTCLLLASMARSTAIACVPRPSGWQHCLGPSPLNCIFPPLPPTVKSPGVHLGSALSAAHQSFLGAWFPPPPSCLPVFCSQLCCHRGLVTG